MKKHIILGVALSVATLAPALFADTTGTGSTTSGSGSTTSTGITSTGSTATGSVSNTGTTNTGTTSTGSTATGTTSTGGVLTGSTICGTSTGIQTSRAAAQKNYLNEMIRLLTEKRDAYSTAFTLSGTARVDAMKVANEKFRLGVKTAQTKLKETRNLIKINTVCKKIEDLRSHKFGDDNSDNRNNMKKEVKIEKKIAKEIKKTEKEIQKFTKKNGKR